MTPDEVVINLQDLLKDDWDLMRWKEAEQSEDEQYKHNIIASMCNFAINEVINE